MKLFITIAVAVLLVGCKAAPKMDVMAPDEMVLGIQACEALGMPLQRATIVRQGGTVTFVATCSDSVFITIVVKAAKTTKEGWKDES